MCGRMLEISGRLARRIESFSGKTLRTGTLIAAAGQAPRLGYLPVL